MANAILAAISHNDQRIELHPVRTFNMQVRYMWYLSGQQMVNIFIKFIAKGQFLIIINK